MLNTTNPILCLVLMIALLSFFPSVSHADAVDDAIERHQQESAQRHADKQLNDALDKARGNTQHTSSSGGSVFGTIIGYLILAVFVLWIAVFFLSKIADALDFFGVGEKDKTKNNADTEDSKPVKSPDRQTLYKLAHLGDADAFQQLQSFANSGDTEAKIVLRGVIFAKFKHLGDVDALQQIKSFANSGDVDTQFLLGLKYHIGEDLPKDHAEALKWFRMAAEQGHSDAQFHVGTLYFNPFGFNPRTDGTPNEAPGFAEALKWYLKAAEQGHKIAPSYLETIAILRKEHRAPYR